MQVVQEDDKSVSQSEAIASHEDVKKLGKDNLNTFLASEQDVKTVNEFLSNPMNKRYAEHLAKQIQDNVSFEWFTVEDVVRRSNDTEKNVSVKLQMLGLFDLCICKKGKKNYIYKITLTADAKILFKEEQIKLLQNKIDEINKEIQELKNEQQ